jgi:2-polyprenyl-3-methyl-5-hydroxy-6-metoxy-1,4-benzoquinol methylase
MKEFRKLWIGIKKMDLIDKGKLRTLKRLKEKEDIIQAFPIEETDLMTLDHCGLCDSDEISPISEVSLKSGLTFFSTAACNNCLYTFRTVSPSLDWFKKCWAKIADGKLEVFNPEMEEVRKERYEAYYALLSRYVKGKSLLEIGAAYGTGLNLFRGKGFDVEAIEPEDNKADFIEKKLGIPVVSRSIEDFVSEKREYDLIIFTHCLEHLDDPFFIMSNIKNLMSPAGVLYLEVPVLWNHVTWTDALYLTHKSNFTEENLTRMVNEKGLQVERKVNPQHTPEEPIDFGLVLKSGIAKLINYDDLRRDVDDVRELYRKNLPISVPLNQIIKYEVDSIDHFYQTVRFDKKKIAQKANGVIYFK